MNKTVAAIALFITSAVPCLGADKKPSNSEILQSINTMCAAEWKKGLPKEYRTGGSISDLTVSDLQRVSRNLCSVRPGVNIANAATGNQTCKHAQSTYGCIGRLQTFVKEYQRRIDFTFESKVIELLTTLDVSEGVILTKKPAAPAPAAPAPAESNSRR